MLFKNRPYIETSVRTLSGFSILIFILADYVQPELRYIWLSMLAMMGVLLLQSGFTQICFLEHLLKRMGFRCRIDEIHSMALHDALTSLPNRVLLEDRTTLAISQAARNGKKVAMLFVDLDRCRQQSVTKKTTPLRHFSALGWR